MTAVHVIGIDPGPVPGMVVLEPIGFGIRVVQCDRLTAPLVLGALLDAAYSLAPTLVQVERFVISPRSARSAHAAAGAVTRELVDQVASLVLGRDGVRLLQRSAAQVKPWATDTRLDAAGLLAATKGMRHARDAARHALYCAVHDGGLPDPLSKGARR